MNNYNCMAFAQHVLIVRLATLLLLNINTFSYNCDLSEMVYLLLVRYNLGSGWDMCERWMYPQKVNAPCLSTGRGNTSKETF